MPTFTGDDRNDSFTGSETDDLIDGRGGDDTLNGLGGNDVINGGAGNDRMDGGAGDDVITGGDGNDTVVMNLAAGGSDRVDLGVGDDVVQVTSPTAQVRLTFTSAQVGDGSATETTNLANQDGGLAVRMQAENATGGLTGPISRYDDEGITFVAAGNTTFDVRDLVSGVARGDGFGVVVLGTSGADTQTAVQADRAYYFNAGAGNDFITGGNAADFLVGGSGDDGLIGGAGNDSFIGGAGNDQIFGEAGDDTLIVALATEGADLVNLGDGADVVQVTSPAAQVRLTFTSSEVGNGSATDSNTMANQDGGLAVRMQAEDASGALTGTVSRFDDEGITFVAAGATTFDVRDLVSGVQRGDGFGVVVLGTSGADTQTAVQADRAYYFNAGMGADTVTGGNAADFLVGGAGDDVLRGGAGNDSFIGGGGADQVFGEDGDDTMIVALATDGADRVDLGAGNDVVQVTSPAAQVRVTFTSAQAGNGSAVETTNLANQDGGLAVRLQAEDGSDGLTGPVSRYDDEGITFVAAGATTFDVRDLPSGVARGDGFGVVVLGTSGADVQTAVQADRAYYFNAGLGNDTITGGNAADFLVGGGGDDVLRGGAGNDSFIGGGGSDDIGGGDGDDTVIVALATDGADRVDLGAGNDTVQVTSPASQVRLTFTSAQVGDGSAMETTNLANQDGGLAVRVQAEDGSDGLAGTVSRFDDEGITFVAAGTTTFDVRDLPTGVARGDGFGVVVLGTGGADTQTAVQADRAYYFNAGAGNDTVTGGNAADFLVGGGGDDTLRGGAGNDTFIGGGGNDLMDGGAGVDTADYGASAAGVAVNLFEQGVPNVSGGAGIDTLIGVENLVGSAFSDFLRGDDANNAFTDTGGGNDRFEGRGGNDVITVTRLQTPSALPATVVAIDGGDGDDTLTFNGGTRFIDRVTFEGGNGADVITLSGVDASAINAGAGNDNVSLNLRGGYNTVTLGAGSDTLTLTGAGAEASTVARRNDILDFNGRSGGDRLELTEYLNGSAFTGYTAGSNPFADGYLRLVVSGQDVLLQADRDGRTGTVNSFVTVATFVNGVRSGFTAASLDGFVPNGLFIIGTDGADVLLGAAENDELQGRGGNDEIRGGTGDDVLRGEDGDDFLAGEEGRDFLFGGAGRDVLESSAGGDQLFGDADNDVLIASTADDRMDGGAGTSDTVSYRSSTVAVNVNLLVQGTAQNTGGSGTDTLLNIENIEGGAGNDLLTGDGNANILLGFGSGDSLVGGGGSDYLDGGDGNDTVVGGANFDTLIGGAGNDVFLYQLASDSSSATGIDRIVDFQSGSDLLDLRPIATGNDSFSIATLGAETFVFVDLGRNGTTDTVIRFAGANAIRATDIQFGNAVSSAATADVDLFALAAPAEADDALATVLDIDQDGLLPVARFDLLREDDQALSFGSSDHLFM